MGKPGRHRGPMDSTSLAETVTASPAIRPLRVVYIWDADYPWDVRVEKTCRTLTGAGHMVHLVARNKAWREEREARPEATVHRMPRWGIVGQRVDAQLSFPAFFSPRWWSLISAVVREVGADVIIARDLPLCPTALAVGAHYGVPVILDMAEDYPAMMRAIWTAGRARLIDYVVRNPRAVEAIERYCLRRAAQTWVVSDFLRAQLADEYGNERIVVVGNTPPRANTDIAVASPDRDRLEIAYLGLLEIPRGILELIDATSLLRRRGLAVRLRLIGSGRDEQLFRRRAAELGLDESVVEFLGHVPYADALRLVAGADIGAMPLHRNDHMDSTIPNKVFDYMSVGVPVLTSDVTASAALVRQLDVGEVFTSGNAESLAAAVERMQSPETRQRMGEHGRAAVRSTFNWETDSERLIASVRTAAASRGAGAPDGLAVTGQAT